MERIRVLQVNKAFNPHIGGVEQVVKDIVENLSDKYSSTVLVCNPPHGKYSEEALNSTKIIRCSTLLTFRSLPISFSFFREFCKQIKTHDIVHLHEPFPLGSIVAWMLNKNTPLVITWHSDIVRQNFLKWLVLPFQYLVLKRAEVILVTSGSMKKKSFVRKFKSKTQVIPLSIKDEYVKKEINANESYFLFVGRFVYYKGIIDLMEAIKSVEIPLKLIGSGPLWETVVNQVNGQHLDHVELIKGPVSDEVLRDYFMKCSAFVFPSNAKSEAFGLVQLEAMAAGKPVINTRLKTGVPEVSIDGETGITVNPNAPHELAEAMRKLHENPELRQRLGQNARERVKQHFVHSVTIPKIETIYQNLVA